LHQEASHQWLSALQTPNDDDDMTMMQLLHKWQGEAHSTVDDRMISHDKLLLRINWWQ
jgi:hypothetical protein